MGDKLEISVCCVEPTEPFICEVNGKATIDILSQIEKSLTEDYKELIEKANLEKCDLKLEAIYTEGETQYGTGYGDVFVIPSYYDLTVIEQIPWEVAKATLPEDEGVELTKWCEAYQCHCKLTCSKEGIVKPCEREI